MSLGDFLASLINDPTSPGGGWLANIFGTSPTASTSTPTLAAPPVGQGSSSTNPATPNSPTQAQAPNSGPLNLTQFFRPRTGLLGNSVLGDAVRGAFQGLNASTGYTGGSAFGAGFQGATQGARERQLSQINPILQGQQYQQNQLGLLGQNANLAFQAFRMSRILGRPVSVQELLNNPNLLTQSMQGGSTPAATPTTPGNSSPSAAPSGQSQSPTVTASGTIPIPGYSSSLVGSPLSGSGGTPSAGSPGSNASPPSQGGQGAGSPIVQAVHNAAATGSNTPADQSQLASPANDPNADTSAYDASLDSAINDDYAFNDGKGVSTLEAKKADYDNAVRHAAATAVATSNATFGTPEAFANNMVKLRNDFENQQPVKTMREVQPIYDAATAANEAHKTAKTKDEQLATDMDLTNEVLKLWNPNNSNLRAGTAESIQEAEGYYNKFAKLRQQIMGGTGLSKEVRQAMMNSIQTHYDSYKKAFDTTRANFQKQATMYGKNVPEELWNSGYSSQPQATAASAPATVASAAPPPGAISALRTNPALSAQFDAKYGPGASDKYLQGD